ncbi:MAG TPA: hypothetical protein VFJ84_03680 [Candidatus Saccharimonadales bacterium]|nr:hypothetical protein [Candidatus Saccharimonadales bacterium]
MNAITVSFILPGDTATKQDLLELKRKMGLIGKSYDNAVEAVLYFSREPKTDSSERLVIFTSSKVIPPLQKAIVVSSGDKLIFTSVRNFLADEDNKILNQILSTQVTAFVAPLVKGFFGKVGFAGTTRTSYYVGKRDIVAAIASKARSLAGLLDLASQKSTLVEIQPASVRLPDYISQSQLPRPKKQTKEQPKSDGDTGRKRRVRFSNDIPTFIISRDRLAPLKRLVSWCEKEGLKNIIIIDSASTYPPLLEYYESTPHEVVKLRYNVGYLSPWLTYAVEIYAKDKPYIISDSDVIPVPESHGAVEFFCHLLNAYPKYLKAGFGLKIDDIPDSYEPREYVIAWEKKFWQKEIEKEVYEADIDTTFALWRANLPHLYGPSLRTGGKYIARHETWYMDSKKPSAEMRYYREHADKVIGTWGAESKELPELYVKNKKGTKKSDA